MMLRIGQGFDVHAFARERRLILGGVEIPHERGLAGHSDADVLTHALCDALLGAAGLGDIGHHFPDTDPCYAGADSLGLLSEVAGRLKRDRWRIANADMTIIAQEPKVAPFIPQMRERLAGAAGIDVDRLSIKATTTEHLGLVGRKEGIAALAIALIERSGVG